MKKTLVAAAAALFLTSPSAFAAEDGDARRREHDVLRLPAYREGESVRRLWRQPRRGLLRRQDRDRNLRRRQDGDSGSRPRHNRRRLSRRAQGLKHARG